MILNCDRYKCINYFIHIWNNRCKRRYGEKDTENDRKDRREGDQKLKTLIGDFNARTGKEGREVKEEEEKRRKRQKREENQKTRK